MIVDVHCHYLPRSVADAFELEVAHGEIHVQGRWVGPVLRELTDLSVLLEKSESVGIDLRVLCAPSWLHCYWAESGWTQRLMRAMNEATAEAVRAHSSRLAGLVCVPLQDTEAAIAELRYGIEELDLHGVAVGTNVTGRYFDDPALRPFLLAAAELDVPVFFHPNEVVGAGLMDRYRLVQMLGNPHEATFSLVRMIFGGVLDEIPDGKFCFVQAGGSLPALIGRIDHTWAVDPAVRGATTAPPSAYLPRLYFDSIAHSAEPIEVLLRYVPAERILMGTDYPWAMGEAEPGQSILALPGLSVQERALMMGGNAAELLRLESPSA